MNIITRSPDAVCLSKEQQSIAYSKHRVDYSAIESYIGHWIGSVPKYDETFATQR